MVTQFEKIKSGSFKPEHLQGRLKMGGELFSPLINYFCFIEKYNKSN
jgi:hypothetical protein